MSRAGATSLSLSILINDKEDIREQIQDHIDSIDMIDFDDAEEALDYMDSFHGLVTAHYILERQLHEIQFPSGSDFDV